MDEDLLTLAVNLTFYHDKKATCEISVTPLTPKLGQYDPFCKCVLHLPKMQNAFVKWVILTSFEVRGVTNISRIALLS